MAMCCTLCAQNSAVSAHIALPQGSILACIVPIQLFYKAQTQSIVCSSSLSQGSNLVLISSPNLSPRLNPSVYYGYLAFPYRLSPRHIFYQPHQQNMIQPFQKAQVQFLLYLASFNRFPQGSAWLKVIMYANPRQDLTWITEIICNVDIPHKPLGMSHRLTKWGPYKISSCRAKDIVSQKGNPSLMVSISFKKTILVQ